ncbi:MAG TPA: type II secretion system protein [Azospira sp.]|nr:type II secretion system protein [Azospira sp.]
MQANQKGFTLIELIVVIVILGILAATALPKFIDLSSDARQGVINGVAGSMRSANTMLYGKAAAAGLANQAASATNKVSVNGVDVDLAYGFAKDWTELKQVLDLSPSTDFVDIAAAVGTHDGGVAHNSAASATRNAGCSVLYTAATSATTPPVYTMPATWNCN